MKAFVCLAIIALAAAQVKDHRNSLLSASDGTVNPRLNELTSYELVQPVQSGAGFTTLADTEGFPSSIAFSLNVYGKDFKLELTQNQRLLAASYAEIRMDYGTVSTGVEVSRYTPKSHCFYQGQVAGDSSSSVALSLCSGLRGVVQGHGEIFNIEPAVFGSTSDQRTMAVNANNGGTTKRMMPSQHVAKVGHPSFPLQSISSVPHVVYRDSDISGHDSAWRCGVSDHVAHVEQEIRTRMARKPRVQSAAEEYIELLAFNDNARYRAKGEDTEHDSLTILNMASSYYAATAFSKPLYLVLVGQITFTTADPYQKSQGESGIEVEGGNGLLVAFNNYRSDPASGLPRHDDGQLLSGEMFTSGIRGLAGVGAMCRQDSGSITQLTSPSMRVNAMITAHETGHTMGMMHDSSGNSCQPLGKIMAMATAENTQFSSCSIDYANNFMASSPGPTCLDNAVNVKLPSNDSAPSSSTPASAVNPVSETSEAVSVPIDRVGEP